MSASTKRAERTGSIRDAVWHWYRAINLVMPPSTGSSKTMSAWSRPYWGRAWGRFSTLTARAVRCGIFPSGAGVPVSGHTGIGRAVVVVGAVVAVVVVGTETGS